MVFPLGFSFELVIINFSYFQNLLMESVDQVVAGWKDIRREEGVMNR